VTNSAVSNSEVLQITVERVLGRASKRLAHEIAGFWVLHGAVGNPDEIRHRIGEVLLMTRDREETIVAVASIYPYPTSMPGPSIGFRAFTDPAWRRLSIMIMLHDAIVTTLDEAATEPTAVIFCTDNRKLMGRGNRRWYERRGWRRLSADGAPKDEWMKMVGPPSA
jgi:hypothetical protein